MKRRITLSLGAMALLVSGLALPTSSAVAQQKTLQEQLTGTWMFVSALDKNKDGTTTDRWGSGAKGLAIFDSTGHYSFMITRSNIPNFAVNNVMQGTAAENTAVVQGIIANFGAWSIDEASKTLTTNIVSGSFPNLNGTSQKRIILSLTADELKYTNPATSNGAVNEAIWKRAK
jgi:hypothetical protein